MKSDNYNGWKNRETWNVALWISNDEWLYTLAKECADYPALVNRLKNLSNRCVDISPVTSVKTPDGVSWNDPVLDITSLNAVINEL